MTNCTRGVALVVGFGGVKEKQPLGPKDGAEVPGASQPPPFFFPPPTSNKLDSTLGCRKSEESGSRWRKGLDLF